MKSNFLKLLLSGTFCLFFIQCSNAQVIYTNVVPDKIIDTTNSVYHLDLNNDGITDYNINFTTGTITGNCITAHTSTAYYIKITPLDSNEVGTAATSPFYPKVLLLDSMIDSAAFTWKNTANQLLAEKLWHCVGSGLPPWNRPRWLAYYVGSWNNASNKYLPLRLHVGSQVYYGWVRLSIATGVTNATIFDYAYNTSPGQPILAGEPKPQVLHDTVTSTCSNLSFVIPFYAPPGYYNPGNKFIAQLSDYAGSFNNPILLDSISTTTSDTIFATLPSVPFSGNAYKIRILSTDPAITGPPSASLTLIAPPPPASIVRTFPTDLDSVCSSHGTLYLVANHDYGITYNWYFNGTLQSSSTDSIFNLTSGSGIYTVSESNICGTGSMSDPFTLFVSPIGPAALDSFPQVCWTDPPFALTGGHPSGGYYTGGLAVDSATGMFNPALAFAGTNYVYYTVPDTILTQCTTTATRAIVIFAPPPPASIVRTVPIGLDSVCSSHGTLYLVANHASGLTYNWYFNGTLQSSSTDSIFHLTSGSGIYTVSESNICGSGSVSPSFNLFVSPIGPATLNPFPSVCWTDPPFALTGGHPSGGYFTGGLAVDSATGMFNPALAFVGYNYVYYTVPDTILTQCTTTASRVIVISNCGTSVNEIGSNSASFYSRGKMICVQLSKNYLTNGMILIYDNTGRELKQKNITGEKNEIDMSECSTGIYFVRIQTTMLTEIGRVYIE